MSDRYHSLTVVLEKNMKDEDAKSIIEAIGWMKNVLSVTPVVADPASYMAESRARHDLAEKLWKVLYPEDKP